jgi:hypothetical protein
VREALEEAGPRGFEQELDAVAIGDVRFVDLGHEHQPLGVHEQVALSALTFLAPS